MGTQFGRHELDEERFLLLRDDVPLEIRPKVFDLLVLLLRFRERVVLRNELVMALWGTTAVGAGSLSGLVNELRQILGEAGSGPSSIRTVHGRGYQFVATIESEPFDTSSGLMNVCSNVEPSAHRLTTNESPRDEFPAARCRLRASAARVLAEGAMASLVVGGIGSEGARMFDRVRADLGSAGFDVHDLVGQSDWASSRYSLVDVLVAALVKSRGLEAVRSVIPAHARELLERVCEPERRPRFRMRDPLASRQYEERAWRSMGELLRRLATEKPCALLMTDLDEGSTVAIGLATKLLGLVEDAPVFILVAAQDDEHGGPLEPEVQTENGIEVIPLEELVQMGLNELLEVQGVRAFPESIADALAAHVRGDGGSLESVANWLSAEMHRAPGPSAADGWLEPERQMKRVAPGSRTANKRLGNAV